MPLCNAGGLALVPAMVFWLWLQAARVARERRPHWCSKALVTAALSLPSIVLMVMYFHDYSTPRHHAALGGLWAALRTTAQFLGMGLGDVGLSLWPGRGCLCLHFAAVLSSSCFAQGSANRWSVCVSRG